MNKVFLSGNLTRDPELRRTPSGVAYARMTIAVSRPYSSKNNDGQSVTDFFNLTAWNKTAEFCERYLQKGRKVLVEGRIQNDNYEKDGVKHYNTTIMVDSIEFADSKRSNDNGGGGYNSGNDSGTDDGGGVGDVDVPF